MPDPLELRRELDSRTRAFRQPDVVEVTALDDSGFPLLQAGTVVSIVGEPTQVARLRAAAESGDSERLRELSRSIGQQMVRMVFTNPHANWGTIPAFHDFRYGRTTIAQALYVVPDVWAVSTSHTAYNGGALSPNYFQVVDYLREPRIQPDLPATLVLIVPPQLTALERAVSLRVPSEMSELNIGPSRGVWAAGGTAAWIAAVVGAWAVERVLDRVADWAAENADALQQGMADFGAMQCPDPFGFTPVEMVSEHPESALQGLDIGASAQALLQMRIRLIEQLVIKRVK